MQAADLGGFLTTEEVCDLYRVSRRTVYRWQQEGKLRGTKAGRRLLFERKEVMGLRERGKAARQQFRITRGRGVPGGFEHVITVEAAAAWVPMQDVIDGGGGFADFDGFRIALEPGDKVEPLTATQGFEQESERVSMSANCE